jgi:DNA-binding response OmpR family regulator
VVEKRLLLHCDDDPDATFLLERALQRSGISEWVLESVRSGEQALAYLKRAQRGEMAMPDLLVLDVKMPGMNGFEVLERLRFNRVNIITVMLSVSDDVKDRLRAMDMGSRGYFVKSPNYEDLLHVLRNWETEFPHTSRFVHT